MREFTYLTQTDLRIAFFDEFFLGANSRRDDAEEAFG